MTHLTRTILASALLAAALAFTAPAALRAAGIEPLATRPSPHDVPTTVQRLQQAVTARGAKVVATVDHAAAAKAEGLSLRPTVLVIFGNPKLGTPLMQSGQTAGLDLPLRVLVWEDAAGGTQIGYLPPALLAARHGIADRTGVVETMTAALAAIADEAAAR